MQNLMPGVCEEYFYYLCRKLLKTFEWILLVESVTLFIIFCVMIPQWKISSFPHPFLIRKLIWLAGFFSCSMVKFMSCQLLNFCDFSIDILTLLHICSALPFFFLIIESHLLKNVVLYFLPSSSKKCACGAL